MPFKKKEHVIRSAVLVAGDALGDTRMVRMT